MGRPKLTNNYVKIHFMVGKEVIKELKELGFVEVKQQIGDVHSFHVSSELVMFYIRPSDGYWMFRYNVVDESFDYWSDGTGIRKWLLIEDMDIATMIILYGRGVRYENNP